MESIIIESLVNKKSNLSEITRYKTYSPKDKNTITKILKIVQYLVKNAIFISANLILY